MTIHVGGSPPGAIPRVHAPTIGEAMHLNTKTRSCALMLALASCTAPADVSKPISTGKGADAKVKIIDVADGFNVDVRYSRYQFIPETSAVLVACRSVATARAYEEAKARGREIEPINEQTVRVSTGRNGVLGMTYCRAFAEARWKREAKE